MSCFCFFGGGQGWIVPLVLMTYMSVEGESIHGAHYLPEDGGKAFISGQLTSSPKSDPILYLSKNQNEGHRPKIRGQRSCLIMGEIQGKQSLVHSVGLYSNDFRVVFQTTFPDPQGKFTLSVYYPGTYILAPVPKARGRLIYSPPLGHTVYCKEGKTFQTSFTIEALKGRLSDSDHIHPEPEMNTGIQAHEEKKGTPIGDDKKTLKGKQRSLVVLQIIKGQIKVSDASRRYGIPEERLQEWTTQFIEAGGKALEAPE